MICYLQLSEMQQWLNPGFGGKGIVICPNKGEAPAPPPLVGGSAKQGGYVEDK